MLRVRYTACSNSAAKQPTLPAASPVRLCAGLSSESADRPVEAKSKPSPAEREGTCEDWIKLQDRRNGQPSQKCNETHCDDHTILARRPIDTSRRDESGLNGRLEWNRTCDLRISRNLIPLKIHGNANVALRASILGKDAGEQLLGMAIESIRTEHPLFRHDFALKACVAIIQKCRRLSTGKSRTSFSTHLHNLF